MRVPANATGQPPMASQCRCSRRFLIQILPSAVVAPLYFQGKIDFGVINQSSSAFNHILSDVSLVVYQVRRSGAEPCSLPWYASPDFLMQS